MSRPLSDKELKHFGRSLSGHMRDKDRERWKRKVTGQAAPPAKPLRAIRDEVVAESAEREAETLDRGDDEIQ